MESDILLSHPIPTMCKGEGCHLSFGAKSLTTPKGIEPIALALVSLELSSSQMN